MRSPAMRSLGCSLGVFGVIGAASILALPGDALAGGRLVLAQSGEAMIVEARASRSYGTRRRRARRGRTVKEIVPAPELRTDAMALPKRNPRRPGAKGEAASTKRSPAKTETSNAAPPPPEPAAPPPPLTWSQEDVLDGREKCLVAIARIVVDITPAPPMRTGQCGSSSPVMLHSVGSGTRQVTLRPPAMLNCDMVQAVHDWIEKTVQPTAREMLGEDVVRLESVAGYQCRNRAGTGRLSEHGLANAIDILGFTTRSGHTISVLDAWGPTQRDPAEPAIAAQEQTTSASGRARPGEPPLPLPHPKRAAKPKPITARVPLRPARATPPRAPSLPTEQFLKRVHERSCDIFKTVLGPEANEDHRNHFHLDLAQRKRGAHYCR